MRIVDLLKLKRYIKNIDSEIKVKFGNCFECDTDRKIVSALHEVGHIMTWTQELEDERTEMYGLMEVAHNYQLMSIQELNEQYFEIPMELIATEWGRAYYRGL